MAFEHPTSERLQPRTRHVLDPATEEFLRFYTPRQGTATFSDDVDLEGHHFKEGEQVWISWAMANRDPGRSSTSPNDDPGP